MQARFARNIPALTGEECALLRRKKVAVIGCGGLGGYLIELLARIGIGQIVALDGDVFEETNLNRQILSDMTVLGMPKAEAAAARVAKIDPEITVTAVNAFLTEENAPDLIRGCDAVLDGLDNIPARKALARACAREKIPYIYGAISGWVAQAGICLPGEDLVEKLYPEGTVLTDKSVLSFTPALCASLQASLCIRLLTGREVPTGALLYLDLMDPELEMISMN